MKGSWRSRLVGVVLVGLPAGWYAYHDVNDVPVAGTWTVDSAPGYDADLSGLWVRFPSNESGDYVSFNGCYRSGAGYSAGFGDHFTASIGNEAGYGCAVSGEFDWDVLAQAQRVALDGDHLVIEDGDGRRLVELAPSDVETAQ